MLSTEEAAMLRKKGIDMPTRALQQALSFIDSWLGFHERRREVPGFGVAIYADGQLVFDKAYGYSNVETREALTPEHLINVGSQAKMYTATAIVQLAGANKLPLHDRVVAHLPWAAAHPDPAFKLLTIEQLLRHTSGLAREGHAADYWQLIEPFPDAKAFERLVLQATLAQERELRPKYSNLGYALLGQMIERASGQSYAAYVQRHILEPLGLRDTFVEYDAAFASRQATGYTPLVEAVRLTVPKDIPTRSFTPVAGLYMTAADACRFMAAQCSGDTRLFGEQVKRTLHAGGRQ